MRPWCSAGAKVTPSPSASSPMLHTAAPGDVALAPLHALQRFCCSCSLLSPAVPSLPSPSRRPAPRSEVAELLRAAAWAGGAGTWQKSLRLREAGTRWGHGGDVGRAWGHGAELGAGRWADAEQPGQVRGAGVGSQEQPALCPLPPSLQGPSDQTLAPGQGLCPGLQTAAPRGWDRCLRETGRNKGHGEVERQQPGLPGTHPSGHGGCGGLGGCGVPCSAP